MAALAIVLVLLLIALVFRDHPNSTEPRLDRLAVLPLANLTGNPDQEYFVRGVHEALIAQLSRLADRGRTTARRASRAALVDRTLRW